ncbi:MAG TPA: hypothetical protein VE959_02765 [Bryobacteraceae bacterium]|nr:hypothetical protein [Bryobacteraceae bacterium]
MKIFLCVLLTAVFAIGAAAADVSGKWTGSYTFENGNSGAAFMTLKQAGAVLSGTAGPAEDSMWPIQNGKIQGNTLIFEIKSSDDGTIYKCQLTLSGDSLKGEVSVSAGDQSMKGKLELSKVK